MTVLLTAVALFMHLFVKVGLLGPATNNLVRFYEVAATSRCGSLSAALKVPNGDASSAQGTSMELCPLQRAMATVVPHLVCFMALLPPVAALRATANPRRRVTYPVEGYKSQRAAYPKCIIMYRDIWVE
ncbi:hypothetical protein FOZ63_002071, partial [Perkinsus olseni]